MNAVREYERGVSVNINMSMLMSRAWQTVNSRQRVLYLCCKAHYYSANKGGNNSENNQGYFEFPRRLWLRKDEKLSTPAAPAETYNLYNDNKYFYKDIAVLIDHGFIDCIHCGVGFGRENLYSFSDRWRNYGQDGYTVPEEVRTTAMRGARNNSKER